MTVDNAIVVIENIYRHIEMGKSRAQAALDGTVEVWGAILASTLTTIAVFLPGIIHQRRIGTVVPRYRSDYFLQRRHVTGFIVDHDSDAQRPLAGN